MFTGRCGHDHFPAALARLRWLALHNAAFPPTLANLRRIAPLLDESRALGPRRHGTPPPAWFWPPKHRQPSGRHRRDRPFAHRTRPSPGPDQDEPSLPLKFSQRPSVDHFALEL